MVHCVEASANGARLRVVWCMLHVLVHITLRKVLFLVPSAVCSFLVVYEVSREPMNGFAPNLVARSNVSKVKRQDHQAQKRDFFQPSRRPAWGLFGTNTMDYINVRPKADEWPA